MFSTGKQLLKSSDNDRLAEACAQSGWALIGAYLTLGINNMSPELTIHSSPCFSSLPLISLLSGPVYIRSQLKVVLSLWHNVFPHSHRELTAELKGGSSSSWTKLLEMRTGALSCKPALEGATDLDFTPQQYLVSWCVVLSPLLLTSLNVSCFP